MDKPAYHNTTDETKNLNEYEAKARKCDLFVLNFMKKHPGQSFTPAEVWKAIDPDGLKPVTSIRRAMSNLTDAGLILHRVEKWNQKIGLYGRLNTTWVYPETPYQQKLF